MMLMLLAGLAAAAEVSAAAAVAAVAQAAGEGALLVARGERTQAALVQALDAAPHLQPHVRLVARSGDVPALLSREGAGCALLIEVTGSSWWLTPYGSCGAVKEGDLFGIAAKLPPAPTIAPAPAVVSRAPAAAPAPAAAAPKDLVEELVGLRDHAARQQRLTKEIAASAADPDKAARLGNALAVVGQLQVNKRSDPSIVRLFLRAAMADDPAVRSAALAAAASNGDPPAVAASRAPGTPAASAPSAAAPAPAVATAEAPRLPPDPGKLRQYKQQRLVRDKLSVTTGSSNQYGGSVSTTVTWAVYDGGGSPYTAQAFAQKVGDSATLRELEEERRKAYTAAGIGVPVGVLALVVSYRRAVDDEERAFGDIFWGTVSAAGAGTILFPILTDQRQQFAARYYSPGQADSLIEKHNAQLREKLGLTEADVQNIDLGYAPPSLQLQPVIGPGWVGVAGTF